jgi:SSS family transporter
VCQSFPARRWALFTPFDYVLLCLYFAAVTFIGGYFYRRSSTSAEFFVGGRTISWLPVAISVIAADTSAITLLGSPGYAYEHNTTLFLYELGYPVAAWLVILIFLPFYCRLKLYTAYEYLEKRFDVRVRWITSALFLIIRGSHVAIAMYAPAIVLTLFTRIPLHTSILLMGIVATFYTTLGGIRAVIWTDVMQFAIVATGIAFTFFLTITRVYGGLGAIGRIGSEYGKWHTFDFSLSLTSDSTFWAMFVGGTVLALATIGTDQAVLQRYFTAKSEAECRRSLKAYSIILIPFNFAMIILGVFLFAFYHQHPDLASGLKSSDWVLPYFAMHQLPHLLATLLTAAIFAASMGVVSAGINSLSTCTVVDFYRRIWRKDASEAEFVRAGRISTLGWGVFTTIGALYAGRLGELALAFGKIQGYVGGVMLGIFLLAIFSRRANALGAIIGSVLGMAVVSYVAFWTDISFFWYGIVGGGVTIIAGYAASMLGPKPAGVPDNLFWRRPGTQLPVPIPQD